MPSEDSYFSSGGLSNHCPRCGAGMHNDYQHHNDCLINVPIPYMPFWRRGFNDARAKKNIGHHDGSLEAIIYMQGYGLGAKLNAAEIEPAA